jgi:hypothetical protein
VVAAALRRCRGCGCELGLGPRPRLHVCEACGWEPAPGPQTQFLAETAFEALYGGAAGGGKSEALITLPLRWVNVPGYRAVIFRRQAVDLIPSVIDRALKLYPRCGVPGRFVQSPRAIYHFDSGARVYFAHLQNENDIYDWDSTELHTICFDELSHFLERQYVYMQSRLRSPPPGVPLIIRSGTNPPEDATGAWLLKRFAPWVDRGPDYHGLHATSGQRLYVVNSRQKGEMYVQKGTLDEEGNPARARVFIQARVSDNPYVEKTYRSTLLGLDDASRARKLDGDWSRMEKPGALWQRTVLNAGRVVSHPTLYRIGVAIDPSGAHRKGSDEAGIVAGGLGPCFCTGERANHAFIFDDASGVLPAEKQAMRAISIYNAKQASAIVAEVNYGGDWVKTAFRLLDDKVNVQVVHATHGKAVRADPVAALYGRLVDAPEGTKLEGCRVHHVGTLSGLESECCTFDPRDPPRVSPGRMDALVWLLTWLFGLGPSEGTHDVPTSTRLGRGDRGRMMT